MSSNPSHPSPHPLSGPSASLPSSVWLLKRRKTQIISFKIKKTISQWWWVGRTSYLTCECSRRHLRTVLYNLGLFSELQPVPTGILTPTHNSWDIDSLWLWHILSLNVENCWYKTILSVTFEEQFRNWRQYIYI